jgi:hypothetical protein
MSAVLAGALALGIVLGGLELADVSLVDLLRDPSAVSDSPWWSGSISLVGLLFWGGTVGMLPPGVDVGYRAGVLEDYAKYVGLVALLAWALTVTRRELLAVRRPARESADTLRP